MGTMQRNAQLRFHRNDKRTQKQEILASTRRRTRKRKRKRTRTNHSIAVREPVFFVRFPVLKRESVYLQDVVARIDEELKSKLMDYNGLRSSLAQV
jgi:hypothetical protein